MMQVADQAMRDRFATEHQRSFSVIAAAGSGKTSAITERIVSIAQSQHGLEWLPQLVVVTFTNRAADEMQQRSRQRLLDAEVPIEVHEALNRAFFGTIHSFCVRLLQAHGHLIGLPGKIDLVEDDTELWREFVRQHTVVGANLSPAARTVLFRHVAVRDLLKIARQAASDLLIETAIDECPSLDCRHLLEYQPPRRGSGTANVERSKQALREWLARVDAGDEFVQWPERWGNSEDFRNLWQQTFGPLRDWVRKAALCSAAAVAREFREFRINRGALTYDDQVALAHCLLCHPEAARQIREKGYRIVLDEAQDTDPTQFSVLLDVARPPTATGHWPENPADPPRNGHFCMVGDFQQSIYGSRANLRHYRAMHDALVQHAGAEALEFSVTFRLDSSIIDFLNDAFPAVLNGNEGQAAFVRLHPRPAAFPGQVVRLPIHPIEEKGTAARARHEAAVIADWIRETGLERLRARRWSDVALLCPRKAWFSPLKAALRSRGFSVQVQSDRDILGDNPAYAWFTALIWIMAHPTDSFEIVGVLREVFGLSDHELAVFSEGKGKRFQVEHPPRAGGCVGGTLTRLHEIRASIISKPLYAQVEAIIAGTELRERLQVLPSDEYDALLEEINDLCILAAVAEADGATLVDFADQLKRGFDRPREVRVTQPDAIQLITAHKAKGSEWDAVIVPFLGRTVYGRTISYPVLIRDPRNGEPLIAFDGDDRGKDVKEALRAIEAQEGERLAYVALTRARHTLVLVDDFELFGGQKRSSYSQGQLTRCDAGSANSWLFKGLPEVATECPQTAATWNPLTAGDTSTAEPGIAPVPGECWNNAPAAALEFVKHNPSALVILPDEDDIAENVLLGLSGGTISIDYGHWWHGFVEHLRWNADPREWDEAFARALPNSPVPERSRTEWQKLREQLVSDTPLSRLLRKPGTIAHAELPFLWQMKPGECLEGIMDLTIYDPETGEWVVLDWKTNPIEPAHAEALRDHYEPQLAAYVHALRHMFSAPVRAGIYSTATGCWLPYDPAAIEARWQALQATSDAVRELLGEDIKANSSV